MKLKGHTNWITDILIMPNDKLISSSQDNTIKIWDLNSK
jgi:WD40 repeat protein